MGDVIGTLCLCIAFTAALPGSARGASPHPHTPAEGQGLPDTSHLEAENPRGKKSPPPSEPPGWWHHTCREDQRTAETITDTSATTSPTIQPATC
jgi:hypothetical protein